MWLMRTYRNAAWIGQAHRIARIHYGPRALSFGFTFLVLAAVLEERGVSLWILSIGALQFLVYPHLAYLHARMAADSKRAERTNLYADALMLGVWTAQMQFALWPCCGLLAATSLNNAAYGGVAVLGRGLLLFVAGAAFWGAALGFPFHPATGPLVSGLCAGGMVAYLAWVGLIAYEQNRRIVRARNDLRASEGQFRFIAEHAGDLVVVLDRDGRLRYASPSHAGYHESRKFALGQPWIDLVHPDDRVNARQFLEAVASSESSERAYLRLASSRGTDHVMQCHANPVRDEQHKLQMIVLVMHDVTARMRQDIATQLAAYPSVRAV